MDTDDLEMRFYGAGATSGSANTSGRAAGTLVMEMRGWNTHMLSSMTFAILAQEVVRGATEYLITDAMNDKFVCIWRTSTATKYQCFRAG